MKNKLRAVREKITQSKVVRTMPAPVRWIIGVFGNNLGLKLLSLLLAILLWNYVISTNTSITRPKTIYNLTGYMSGQSSLNSAGLALLDDPTSALSGIAVTVEAPQAQFSRISADNVQVTLDLSSVRSAGSQEVALSATSNYGRVVGITPQSLTLTFESMDSRTVAVNPVITGEDEAYWYNISRTNPTMISVSGAASVVQSIASARVEYDVAGVDAAAVTALPYTLLDAQGEEVPQEMLNRSTSSISLTLEVYPRREMPVSTQIDNVVTGQPAEGYYVESVSIQPETIVVAAEHELLNSLTELMIEPVSVEGVNQSFSARASLSQLSNFKNVSSDQVYVNVTIGEEMDSAYIDDVSVVFIGKAENLNVTYEPMRVYVSGPQSAVEQIRETGFVVYADLTDLEDGYYLLNPSYDAERYPDVTVECESVSVTLTDISGDD